MTWDAYHTESEQLAGQAEAVLARGERGQAQDLYRRAAEAEERAYFALAPEKSRTRGITGVSALSLWSKAGARAQVARLGERLLASESLPHFARMQIREILEDNDGSGGATRNRYEVEIIVRQKLRYAVNASNRAGAECEAVERWRTGELSLVDPSDSSELVDVHTRPVPAE